MLRTRVVPGGWGAWRQLPRECVAERSCCAEQGAHPSSFSSSSGPSGTLQYIPVLGASQETCGPRGRAKSSRAWLAHGRSLGN